MVERVDTANAVAEWPRLARAAGIAQPIIEDRAQHHRLDLA